MKKRENSVEVVPILLDAEQLGQRYGIATKTVRKWQSEGKLPYYKMSRRCVRYPVAECDEIILGKLVKKQEAES